MYKTVDWPVVWCVRAADDTEKGWKSHRSCGLVVGAIPDWLDKKELCSQIFSDSSVFPWCSCKNGQLFFVCNTLKISLQSLLHFLLPSRHWISLSHHNPIPFVYRKLKYFSESLRTQTTITSFTPLPLKLPLLEDGLNPTFLPMAPSCGQKL